MKPKILILILVYAMFVCCTKEIIADPEEIKIPEENETVEPTPGETEPDVFTYYQKPVSTIIASPGEQTFEFSFYGGEVSKLQKRLETVRGAYPNELLIVHIRGLVNVSETPLILGSKTCLSFEGCGKMVAENAASCDALIHIKDAEYVSITAVNKTALALLDGNNVAKSGIQVTNSGKINIDNVNIKNCKELGVNYFGRGEALLNDAGSVTRCIISSNGMGGIRVKNAARFVLMDNVIANHSSFGINAVSKSTTVVGNTCTKSNIGIELNALAEVDGPGSVITRNILKENTVGLKLGNNSEKYLVTENYIQQNGTGMIVNGTVNHLFNNEMSNSKEFEIGGVSNVIVGHKNVSPSEIEGGNDSKYFNPPTMGNHHKNEIIVEGMGRQDITFRQESGSPDVDLAAVQTAIDYARATYTNDVIVIWLEGNFVAKGDHTGIDMPENSCIILDGTIYPEGAGMDRESDDDHYQKGRTTGGTQLVLMKSSGYASFSGGKLDCRDHCAYGIYAPGKNVGLIDSVDINGAVDNNIGVIYHSGAATPMFIGGCKFNGNGKTNRGIWVHVCSYIHTIACQSENHVADFVDIDAAGHWNTVLFGKSHNENRTGVFIEEKASNNVIIGNVMTGDVGNGISLYSAIGGQCENNIIVGNTVTGPNGMNIRHAKNTFAFNNIMNTGQFGVYLNANDNYSAQNTSIKNNYNMSDILINPFFTSPYFSFMEPNNDCGL